LVATVDDLVDALERVIGEHDLGGEEPAPGCSIVRGPMIAAVITGWLRRNAIIISVTNIPTSSASRASWSAASSLR
jgi:hypothetical protein